MKNKHLLLLFAVVLVLGWLSKWIPLGASESPLPLFRPELHSADRVLLVASDSVLLYRVDSNWLQQSSGMVDKNVFNSAVQSFIQLLVGLEAIERQPIHIADSLGLGRTNPRLMVVHSPQLPRPEQIQIGKTEERKGERMTWIRLNDHSQCYLVNADLSLYFSIDWAGPTNKVQLAFDSSGLIIVQAIRTKDTVAYQISNQESSSLPITKGNLFDLFREAALVDLVDPGSHRETIWGELLFKYQDSLIPPLRYRLFYLNQPEMPDDPDKRRYFRQLKAQYLIESGKQPGLYFSITDTLAIHRLFYVHKKEKN